MQVTIILISYNQEMYIRKCISSILEQSIDFECELIIADDCSTDSTLKIINEELSKSCFNYKILDRPNNLGVNANLMDAISKSQGEFIAICEGDDYWLDQNKLNFQYSFFKTNNSCNIAFTPALSIREGYSKLINWHGAELKEISLSQVIVNRGGFMPTASLFLRKSVVENLPKWFKEMSGCDHFLQIISSFKAGAIYMPIISCAYREMSVGSWSSENYTSTKKQLNNLNVAFEYSFKLEELILGSSKDFFKLRNLYVQQVIVSSFFSLEDKKVFYNSKRSKDISNLNKVLMFMSCKIPLTDRLFDFLRKLKNA